MNNQIGNKINDKTYIPLTPFKGFVLENFPFIEADFDAITNYQLLCKVIDYLNNVISNQNTVQELGTDLVNAYNSLVDAVSLAINSFEEDITGDFNDLKNYVDNYFDNNFPQLVSNKLDEMAEDGTLQNLLDNYANVQKTYNTYTELIADSSTFINGLRLKTLGYYAVNDGGQAEYIVTNTANIAKYQVELSNDLYLELIYTDVICPLSIGAKGNGIDNDSSIINSCFNYASIIDGKNKTYKATITISSSNIEFKNFKILGSITFSTGLRFININNIEVDATNNDYGINATSTVTKLIIDNCYIHNATLVGLNLIDCWDGVITRASLSSNGKGFYASQFNHGYFQGTAYENDIGIHIISSFSIYVNATCQENRKTGMDLRAVNCSTFDVYLEQNGYQGTTLAEQSQLLVGNNESRCLSCIFNIYGMGGSGSTMESPYGATFLSALNCSIIGRFERHTQSGLRVGSACLNCTCEVIDVNHQNYGYDLNLQQAIYRLGEKNLNEALNIDSDIKLLYSIRSSVPVLTSIEHPTSQTTIIRAVGTDGQAPVTTMVADVYAVKPCIITSL